jgi:uncharacterized protein (TIGR02996 family)
VDFYLSYMERTPDGETHLMLWQPKSPQEIEDANRFYDAARGVGPDAWHERRIKPGTKVQRSDEENKYFRAIVTAGHTHESYLEYADWLAARGDPLAEFIRACVDTQRLPDGHPESDNAYLRWAELLDQYGTTWLAPVMELGLRPEIAGDFNPAYWLHTSPLVTELSIDRPGVLPELADRLFAAAPLLRSLELDDEDIDFGTVATLPQTAQIEELAGGGDNVKAADVKALTRSPHTGKLRKLTIRYSPLGRKVAELLAASDVLGQLTSLDLHGCELGDEGVRALVGSTRCRALRNLGLGDNELTGEGITAVASSPNLVSLVSLDLGSNLPGADALKAFAHGACLSTLRELDLSSTSVGVEEAVTLASVPFESLEKLILAVGSIGPDGMCALVGAGFFRRLRMLGVNRNDPDDEGAVALAALEASSLVELALDANEITDEGLVAMCRSNAFRTLTNLSLLGNPITAAGLKTFAASNAFPALATLDLRDVELGDDGSRALARSPHLQAIERLRVTEELLGRKGKAVLIERFGEAAVGLY